MALATGDSKDPSTLKLHVEGMACSSCAGRVDTAIRATPGVVSASVDLEGKRAVVTFSGTPDAKAVIVSIAEAGYEAALETS